MECHEGAKMIKSFRGLIADGGQDTINLHSNDGKTGYRIVKFEVISNDPTGANVESIVQVWSVAQTALVTTIDFSNQELLAVAYFSNASAPPNRTTDVIIFDDSVFNQDIYVTVKGGTSTDSMNYHLELEQMSLDPNEATVATLQSIRNA